MRNCATDSTPEIEIDKASRSPQVLDARAEHPQRQHVERDVPQTRVHEHVRRNCPPLRRELRRLETECSKNTITAEQRDLEEIHSHVRRYQPLNGWRHSGLRLRIVRSVHCPRCL